MDGILIVTPREDLAERWRAWLGAAGVCAERARALADGERAAARLPVSVALVDWALVSVHPRARLESLRRAGGGRCAVALFAPERELFSPRLNGAIESGADELVSDSIGEKALVAKVRVLGGDRAVPAALEAEGLRVEPGPRRAWIRRGKGWKEVPGLTRLEFDLLLALFDRRGRPWPRRDLLDRLWGDGASAVNGETVDRHIGSLRRKLGPAGRAIRTVFKVGYAFE